MKAGYLIKVLLVAIILVLIGLFLSYVSFGPYRAYWPACSPISENEVSCQVSLQMPFNLFNESYYNVTKCGLPPTGGCFLSNFSYDKDYLGELPNVTAMSSGGCYGTIVHGFIGIKKGDTEIVTSGTCQYAKTYRIHIA